MTNESELKASKTVVEEVAAKAVSGDATFDLLMAKPRRSLSFDVTTQNAAGDEVVLRMKYLAISGKAYDEMIAEHPPTAADKKANQTYNMETFAPALISAVSCIPKLSITQATSIYKSGAWSGGETGNLFMNGVRVCNAGLDVPFSARD